ncbi:MAG TPA: hypothetical protein VGD97_11325 [Lacunisphaera sp.]
MKPAGFHLLVFAVAGTLVAEEPTGSTPERKTSARLTQEIRVALPKFTPPPPPVLDQPKSGGTEADPNVLALPKFTVKEKRPPTHDPDVWLSRSAIQHKAMAAYRESMTDFEWALNSWFIPLFSPPASVRARAHYQNSKMGAEISRLNTLIHQIGQQDPAASAELRQELKNMVEGRPVGSK